MLVKQLRQRSKPSFRLDSRNPRPQTSMPNTKARSGHNFRVPAHVCTCPFTLEADLVIRALSNVTERYMAEELVIL